VRVDRQAALVTLYLTSNKLLQRAYMAVHSVFIGICLGLFSRATFDAIDEQYYGGETMYWTDEYNRSGLSAWEAGVVERWFPAKGRVLVAAAGAGREVIALADRFEAVGFECNARLRDVGNRLLDELHVEPPLAAAGRDQVAPGLTGPFDGAIVGWGAYTHIPGHATRVRFLQEIRALCAPGAPVLVSFYVRGASRRPLQITLAVARFLRRLRGVPGPDLGDSLSPTFAHYFTRREIDDELRAGGFDPVAYAASPYGHAVGLAS
jgi:hypothetical protein